MSDISPIPRSDSLAKRTYTHLKDLILTHSLRPGQSVTETWLADTLGVSRTPIRQAISRLSSEGLVRVDRGGIHVRQISMSELRDVGELRLAIEGYVARVLARNGIPTAMAEGLELLTSEMALLVDDHGECHDIGQFMMINRIFHLRLVEQVGNQMLIDTDARAHDLLTISRQTLRDIPGRASSVVHEHKAILDAILRSDCHGSEKAVHVMCWLRICSLVTQVLINT